MHALAVDAAILKENADQRARLERLVGSEADLTVSLGGGWTVGVALAHMAFWDRRACGLLREWDQQGQLPDPVNEQLLNEVLLAEWQALEPEVAGRLAVEAARAVDAAVEAMDGDKADAIAMMGNRFMLARGDHRREHLDQIEQALG